MKLFRTDYSPGKVERYYGDAEGNLQIRTRYDCTDVLKSNRAQQSLTIDQRYGKEMMHHVAEFPPGVILEWRKEGIDIFNMSNPEMQKRVRKKLDDPDWQYLKTTVHKLSRKTIGT